MIRRSVFFSLCVNIFGALSLPVLLHAAVAAPLADAVQQRDGQTARKLIRQRADVNAAQGDGMTALHWAASHGDADLARALTSAGASVKAVTRINKYTPLFLASQYGHALVIQV